MYLCGRGGGDVRDDRLRLLQAELVRVKRAGEGVARAEEDGPPQHVDRVPDDEVLRVVVQVLVLLVRARGPAQNNGRSNTRGSQEN